MGQRSQHVTQPIDLSEQRQRRAPPPRPPREEFGVGIHPCTDLANGHRVKNERGDDLRFTQYLGWLVWDGKRWAPDATNAAMRHAHAVARGFYEDADALDDSTLRKWGKESQNQKRLQSALSVAAALEGISTTPAAFDTNPMLLTCANGTLDLRTGARLPHVREHMITRASPVDFDAAAECPTWLAFLDRIFRGDAELIDFVQRAIGYSLTGDCREQCFFVCYGTGANGKSTLLETIRHVLGDAALNTSTDTFLRAKNGRGAENDVARLRGSRFVSAVESGEGRQLDEERIKRITGGDTITARFLFKEFFEFQPTFKIWLAVNDRPDITGVDHGIWRRIRLLPFSVTIPDHERDLDLPAKLQAEAPGILAWAVRGCIAWQARGLEPPSCVSDATADWKHEANPVARFVAEACDQGPSLSATAKALFSTFTDWAKEIGEPPGMSAKAFAMRLGSLGFTQERTKKARLWRGLSLRRSSSEADDTDPDAPDVPPRW